MRILASVCSLILAGAAFPAGAQSARPAGLDLTLVDAPYNVSFGGRSPSMRQSMDLAVGFTELTHGAIERAFGDHRTLGRVTSALYDFVTTAVVPLPLATPWLHEEFHRAQMGRRGVGSFNDVYRFEMGASAIYVSHVRDADIVALKAAHPAEWVRVGSAGIEGEQLHARELQTRSFRGQSRGWHVPLYWLTKLSTSIYVASSTWPETDPETDTMNIADGASVERRDFTGHDLLAWVYDLHRPTESYAARGTHPSGVGIDRYVKTADLTPEERRFIERMGRLQMLNFADPFLVGFDGVTIGNTVTTASLSHFLSPSGYSIDANVWLKRGGDAAQVIARAYVNDARTLPGIEATVFDRPLRVGDRLLELTPRAALWLQPKDLAFRATDVSPGGLVSLRVRSAGTGRLRAFVELEGKTGGWVAGSPYLDAGVSLRTGITVR